MLIIYGAYRFGRRRVAYRSDFCLPCEGERLSESIRSFFTGHLYGIPLLPLGFHREWRCTTCGRDPTVRTRTSRGLVLAFTVLVGLMAALMTVAALKDIEQPEAQMVGLVGLGTWGLTGLLAFVWHRMRPGLSRKALLARIRPSSTESCAFCGGRLAPGPGGRGPALHCPACKVERLG